ncbi:Pectin degradation repressor protein kdgR [Serratia fonticola]|uniref:Pectin degradation repressor protein kdgR n=1 Tax=Serratia fonticola TaxID=47917 RepID=A0A3S5F370_SERFO|nr:Pectin degradation repressor protein kdgR [Serratia fonticola]
MADDQACKYLIPGLDRGLQLLLAFGEQHKEMTFAELHRLVDMPKATAYRVVQTLEHLGFLERNPRTNTFALGIKVLRLGFEYIASLDVAQAGQPVIEQLRDRSQCSSHLAIRDGHDVIYIARVSAAGSQINQVSVGTRLPAHRTSLGRMLLTSTSREEFERLYPHDALPDAAPGHRPIAKRCGRWCNRIRLVAM